MRKIVKHPANVRLEAIVEKDGVGFIPTKIAGPAALSFGGRFARVDEESGKIKCNDIHTSFDHDSEDFFIKSEMDEKIKKSGFNVLLTAAVLVVAALAMMVVSIILSFGNIWVNVFSSMLWLMMSVVALPQAIAIFVEKIFKRKDMLSFSKFLGAKNAVENAYYDLGRAPTMEEAKTYSLYASEDKYTKSSFLAVLWLVIGCVRFLDGLAYWIVTICAVLLLWWLEGKDKLAFIQALVVSKPDEIHYKAAIATMEEVADELDHVEFHFQEIEFSPDPENFDEERCSKSGCPAYDFCKEKSQKMAKNKGDNDSAK